MTTTPQPARAGHEQGAVRILQSDEILTAAEAADLLGISTSTLSRMVGSGALIPLRRKPDLFHSDDVAKLRRA